ncbi:MAG: SPASM domain-containing protein, partial [Candidatus Omnitrophica bacterium]|nr:SPASM domain-containing protein [Candidatus Omnitrophota bacterium]
KNISISIEKILEYRRKSKIKISIGNPVPFCAYDPDKVSRVSNYKCSIFNLKKPSDFTIDFDGSISPCSLLDLDLGSFLEMRSPGLLKRKDRFASLQDSIMPVLPEPCRDCDLFKDCGSACRAVSRIIYNDYKHLDYLADPEKYL